MPAFVGFPAGKTPYVPLPQTFFTSILPGVEDIGELKLTLYLFQLLYRKRGAPRCVSDRELLADRSLRQALRRKGDPRAPEERLRAALELSVARGTLLRVRVRVDSSIPTAAAGPSPDCCAASWLRRRCSTSKATMVVATRRICAARADVC
jgi:DNA replication protein